MTRPYLTTRDCARVLGVTSAYIRGEIDAVRLSAEVVARSPVHGRTRGNRAIRIYPLAFRAYLGRYWPSQASMFHAQQERAEHAEQQSPFP